MKCKCSNQIVLHLCLPVYDCDFLAKYAMMGMSGAICSHPCSFCAVRVSEMGKTFSSTAECSFAPRPPIEYLRKKVTSKFQQSDTFNIFDIRTSRVGELFPNILPPILHIKIRLGNKLVEVFDNFMEMRSEGRDDDHFAREHLAFCLSSVGAHRKKYYSGIISGGQCDSMFTRMDALCERLGNCFPKCVRGYYPRRMATKNRKHPPRL